ncbi:hypothetical protein V9T40_005252 [Parthenolecanium corni]|uniref:Gamma-interferon-inducible lysosomal thiol reductase n=1 Tax=Parthenolecanium corni TaxID=536013 RepID=A0AAN9TFL0_9HEMI
MTDPIIELYKMLKDNVSLIFVPCGATQKTKDKNGKWNFTCQHGSDECKGNLIQTCALYVFRNEPEKQVDVVTTMMKKYPPFDVTQCLANISKTYQKQIMDCMNSAKGNKLMAKNVHLTQKANPPSFPYMTINGKVNVSVFYETLCAPSIRLIHRQLMPTWMQLKDYVNITFVPYGKAVHEKQADGKWKIECQHGETECWGNKIQACGLHNLKDDADRSIRYIACFMTYNNFYPFNTTCFEDITDNDQAKSQNFHKCVNSEEGNELLAAYGDSTYAVQPSITSVPAITYNGIYDYNLNYKANTDLPSVICDLLGAEKPAPCQPTTTGML